jgi:glyoxylase-like metal-dependent hydrolase (beta-lactamase superfamily II)
LRALALHPDALLVTSALLQVNCVIVRGTVAGGYCGYSGGSGDGEGVVQVRPSGGSGAAGTAGADVPADAPYNHGDAAVEKSDTPAAQWGAESFVIDSPVLPDELDALGALIEQAGFPAPSGLLATHGDWDHLLGRLAFPGAALGVAESTAERLRASPGEAQRQLRSFDEELLIERPRPLALGSVQALSVPGRCDLGDLELELHPTGGHTPDGMAVLLGWAGVLVAGDYLSSVEIPSLSGGSLSGGGDLEAYVATLERLRPLVAGAEHVVPGHGPIHDAAGAGAVLEEDLAYLRALAERGAEAELPPGRRGAAQRELHSANVAALSPAAPGPRAPRPRTSRER